MKVLVPYTKIFSTLATMYRKLEEVLTEEREDVDPAIPVDEIDKLQAYPTIIEACKGVRDTILADGLGKAVTWAQRSAREREVAEINKTNVAAATAGTGPSSSRITRSSRPRSLRALGVVD